MKTILSKPQEGEVILVVDDDPIDREVVEAILERPGRRLIKVESGEAALAYLEQQRVSLVLLDVHMPGIDGFETARRIRTQSSLQDLPILFLTATYSADEFVTQGFAVGAQDYLTKPLNAELLRNKVDIFVRLYHQQQALVCELEERRKAEQALRLNNVVFEHTPEGVMITDALGVIQTVNRAFELTTGFAAAEAIGRTPQLLKSGRHDEAFYRQMWEDLQNKGRWQGEIWNRRKDGAIYPEWLNIVVVQGEREEVVNYVGIFSDFSGRDLFQERLHQLAYYDALTGLPNRQLLFDHLQLALAQARRENRGLAVFYLDLDRFQHTNEALGHPVGDEALCAVARRLSEQLQEDTYLARLGGDNFVAVLPALEQGEDAARLARQLVDSFQQPFSLVDKEIYLSVSIGVSLYPDDGETNDILFAHANTAVSRVKKAGGNGYHLYTPGMNTQCVERLALEADLRRAIEKQELSLAYQPQINLENGELVGVEALARWQHPEQGNIPPGRFIPVAEDAGLIDALGEWALETACRQGVAWMHTYKRPVKVAVNVSANQLSDAGLVKTVTRLLEQTGLLPACLELELTESMLMESMEQTLPMLHQLGELGVQLSIDDFGTGYSSLSYIKRLPIHKLKIDRSFICDVPVNPDDVAIVEAIIAMAHRLNLKVVAEGVETQDQLDFLRKVGCDEMQGYLFSPPIPAVELSRLLERPEQAITQKSLANEQ